MEKEEIKGVDAKKNPVSVNLDDLEERIKRVEAERKGRRHVPVAKIFMCDSCEGFFKIKERHALQAEFNTGHKNPHSRHRLETMPSHIQICDECFNDIFEGEE